MKTISRNGLLPIVFPNCHRPAFSGRPNFPFTRKLDHPHARVTTNEGERKGLAFFLGMERLLSDQALKQGRLGDALAHTGDEGRSTLR